MPERELVILVFAPATVALAVTALRKVSAPVYWAGLAGLLSLAMVYLSEMPQELETIVEGSLAFATVFVIIPTIAAFSVGRLIMIHHGGAYLFAASCAVYYSGLALAVLAGTIPRLLPLP